MRAWAHVGGSQYGDWLCAVSATEAQTRIKANSLGA